MSVNAGVVIVNPPGTANPTKLGNLNVHLTAGQTVQGASWQASGGQWHTMPTTWPFGSGTYTILFSPVPGYSTPAAASVLIKGGLTTELIVTYGTP